MLNLGKFVRWLYHRCLLYLILRSAIVAKIVVVTSGKGGVGKTTTSASFGAGLAKRGFKTKGLKLHIDDISLLENLSKRLNIPQNQLIMDAVRAYQRQLD